MQRALAVLFFNRYARTVRHLEKLSTKTGKKRVSKINTLASGVLGNKTAASQPQSSSPNWSASAVPPPAQPQLGNQTVTAAPKNQILSWTQLPMAGMGSMAGPTNRIPSIGGTVQA